MESSFNLIVFYGSEGGYLSSKNEIHYVLESFGDQKSMQELIVPGVIGVKTILNSRRVIEDLKELFLSDPLKINFSYKWIPVDFWCKSSVNDVVALVKEEIAPLISAKDRFSVIVENHKSNLVEKDVTDQILPLIKGKLDFDYPDKVVRADMFQNFVGVSLLGKQDFFNSVK